MGIWTCNDLICLAELSMLCVIQGNTYVCMGALEILIARCIYAHMQCTVSTVWSIVHDMW